MHTKCRKETETEISNRQNKNVYPRRRNITLPFLRYQLQV